MAEVVYPTGFSFPGPWLISAEDLERLDEIVDRAVEELAAELREALDKDVEAEVSDYVARNKLASAQVEQFRGETLERTRRRRRYETERGLRLHLGEGKSVVGRSFREVASHPEVLAEPARGFKLQLRAGDTSFTLSVARADPTLELLTYGAPTLAGFSLIGSLRQWAAEVAAPRW